MFCGCASARYKQVVLIKKLSGILAGTQPDPHLCRVNKQTPARQMNTKHTPGPWTAKGRKMEARIYGNVEGGPVAVVPYVTEWASNPYDEANARLIAAAPELLAALNEIMISPNSPAAKQRAFDAIAKATNTL